MPNRRLNQLQARLIFQNPNQRLKFPSRNLHSQRRVKNVQVGETVELVQIRIKAPATVSQWLATSQTADSSLFPKNLPHTSKRCPKALAHLIAK
jgi:hypothetical protein